MKMHTNNKTMTLSKKQSKNAMKEMEKELKHILETTDYSTYDISIYYDEKTNKSIIPKPVFALSFVNANLREWIIAQLNMHPSAAVVIS